MCSIFLAIRSDSLLPSSDEVFLFYSKGVRHSVDVVEVSDHLHRVMDCPIVEADRPKCLDVRLLHRPRLAREPFREGAERKVVERQPG